MPSYIHFFLLKTEANGVGPALAVVRVVVYQQNINVFKSESQN